MRRLSIVTLAFCLLGCRGQITINHDAAADTVQTTAHDLTYLGLSAIPRDAEELAKWQGYSRTAQLAIDEAVVPLLNGDSVGMVTRAVADRALEALSSRIDPKLRGVIQLAINAAIVFAPLPNNPAEKLSEEQRRMLVSLFRGVSAGITDFLAQGSVGPVPKATPPLDRLEWRMKR